MPALIALLVLLAGCDSHSAPISAVKVPEPGTFLLFLIGLAILLWWPRR
jgi:hypothetical protein